MVSGGCIEVGILTTAAGCFNTKADWYYFASVEVQDYIRWK